MIGMAAKTPTIKTMSQRININLERMIHKNNFNVCPFVTFQLDFMALSRPKPIKNNAFSLNFSQAKS